jgi:3-hydroxyisobutyrate dehydrogenase-like beta-hydroxyacid dehydrogenase
MDRSRSNGSRNGTGQSPLIYPTTRMSDIQSLLSQGFKVKAYDVYKPSLDAAVKVGAEPCATPAEAGNVDVLGLMVVNALQVEDALFGSGQVAAGM